MEAMENGYIEFEYVPPREVSPEELHSIVVNNLKDFDRFSMEIVSFIKAYEQDRQNNLPE